MNIIAKKKREALNIRVSVETKGKLKQLSENNNMSMTKLVHEWIKQEEEKQKGGME